MYYTNRLTNKQNSNRVVNNNAKSESKMEEVMKKIFGLVFIIMMTLSCFAKEISLQITETDYGLKISNLDSKGKRICKGFLNLEADTEVYTIFETNDGHFLLENLANEIVNNKRLNKFIVLKDEKLTNAIVDKKTQKYGPLSNYDSLLIISENGKFQNYTAISDGKNLTIKLSDFTEDTTLQIRSLIKQYSDEKKIIESELQAEKERKEKLKKADNIRISADEIKEYLRYSDVYKNSLYAYSLNKNGDIVIICYLGDSVDSLFIPEMIEGIPVGQIYSLQSLNNAKFKNITIPKTVKEISDNACVGLGIEKLIFEKDSNLTSIGVNAFRYNEIQELNLPRKKLTIGFDSFSDNKIKKISVYKDWIFLYHTPFYRFSLDYCSTQEDNAFLKSDVLEEVIFEEGCSYIAPKCFAECKNLKKLVIPSTMKQIGAYAFYDCTSLSDISFAGIPLIEVDDIEKLFEKAQQNVNPYSSNALDTLGITAAAETLAQIDSNPFSAAKAFGNCPIGLKVKRTLLMMGLPEIAF